MSQHMEALAKANEVRLGRADVKRRINRGEITVGDALTLAVCARMPLGEMLAAQDRWGPTRVRRFLAVVGLSEVKLIGTLTERQRDMIGKALHRPGRVAE